MADESNIILNMPFDEAAGSTIAYDYSKTRADGTVVEADFTGGKQGNCIKFDGSGHCDIDKNVIPLTGNFTLLAWLKRSALEAEGLGYVADELEAHGVLGQEEDE